MQTGIRVFILGLCLLCAATGIFAATMSNNTAPATFYSNVEATGLPVLQSNSSGSIGEQATFGNGLEAGSAKTQSGLSPLVQTSATDSTTQYIGVISYAVVNYYLQVVPLSSSSSQGTTTITSGSLNIFDAGLVGCIGTFTQSSITFSFDGIQLGSATQNSSGRNFFEVQDSLASFQVNKQYAVQATAESNSQDEGAGGGLAYANVDLPTFELSSNLQSEYRIEVSPNLTSTPEPSTFPILLVLSGSSFLFFGRRRSTWSSKGIEAFLL